MLRAVVEGTAFSLRQVRDNIAEHGLAAERAVLTGGGARTPVQARAVADVLGMPVRVTDVEEGCRGAALLGGVAARLLDLEAARTMAPAAAVIEPDASLRALYDDAYARFLAVQAATDTIAPQG
jgi:sugar (pentulose or hexulose) kinase